jgi:hypothetical protein
MAKHKTASLKAVGSDFSSSLPLMAMNEDMGEGDEEEEEEEEEEAAEPAKPSEPAEPAQPVEETAEKKVEEIAELVESTVESTEPADPAPKRRTTQRRGSVDLISTIEGHKGEDLTKDLAFSNSIK